MTYAEFSFELGKARAKQLAQALLPEGSREIPRTKIKIKTDKDKLKLRIEAEDTSALRAAINSYLRLIKCALEIIEYLTNRQFLLKS
jgi:KEOPS complex subunit Pcc1